MAFSTQRVVSDGTLVQLTLTLDYFDRTEISVLFNGIVSPLVSGKWAWVGTTDKKINFTPTIANGVEVTVQRSTQVALPLHQYTKGAQFIAETLDDNFNQVLRIAQEAREGSGAAEVFNDVDHHGYRIKNVGTALASGDAVSLGQYQADAAGASVASGLAVAAASAAAASQADALVSKNAAASSATAAGTSATNAGTSATNAATSEGNALTSKNAAAASLVSIKNIYYGALASAPTLRPDGTAMQTGDAYFDTVISGGVLRIRQGAAWVTVPSALVGSPTQDFAVQTLTASVNAIMPAMNGGPLAGFRNRLINGRFSVWTRGLNFTVVPGLSYTADRWMLGVTGASNASVSYALFGSGALVYPNDATAMVVAFPAGAAFSNLRQRVESAHTFNGQQVVVSFSAKIITGATTMVCNLVQSFGTGGSPSADVVTNMTGTAVLTGSYVTYTFTGTLPATFGKTMGSNGNDFLELQIQSNNNSAHSFGITAVQLEAGTVATPFEFKPVAVEELACRRYYQQWSHASAFIPVANGMAYSGTQAIFTMNGVTMRATPSVTASNASLLLAAGSRAALTALSVAGHSNGAVYIDAAIGVASLTGGNATMLFGGLNAGGYIALSAEL